MKENTGNVEPTALPKEDLDGDPFPGGPRPAAPASKEDETAALVTPNSPKVIPPDE